MFDTSGRLNGVNFDDEDVLEYDPGAGAWTLAYDGSSRHAGWRPGDVDAAFLSDSDGDGVVDTLDNCLDVRNGDQRDTDRDGYGNICDADKNNDDIVDFLDLGVMKSRFFTADPDCDLNGDGTVDFLDLGLMKAQFFQPPGPSGLDCAGTIPCP